MAEVTHSPAPRSPWEKPQPVGAYPEGEEHYFRDAESKRYAGGDDGVRKPQGKDAADSMTNGAHGTNGFKDAHSVVKSDYKSAIPEESVDGDNYTTNDYTMPEEELGPDDAVDSDKSKASSAANLEARAPKGEQKTEAEGAPSKTGTKLEGEAEPEEKPREQEAPSKVGAEGSSDEAKPAEDAQEENLQRLEPEPIGEDAEQAQEKPAADATSKVAEKKPADGASMAGSAVREGMSKIGSVAGTGESESKQAEEKSGEGATPEEAGEKLAETEAKAEAGETAGEAKEEPEDGAEAKAEEAADEVDYSVLKGGKVNKGGNVINSDGELVGRIKEGVLAHLVGKRVDETGAIWNDSGAVMGRAEPIPEDEREAMAKEPGPFEAFPDAVVNAKGMVVFEGDEVGKVSEGDVKKLRGMKVDADGDILDRTGNVVGKAERWEPEPEAEPEPEPEADRSILAGKRVNKAGNVVDGNGSVFGRVVEGELKRLIGRMCDKKGKILSESGDVIGRAELVPEGEREPAKEGPFEAFPDAVVNAKGMVVFDGEEIGKVTEGDVKKLRGMKVDADGDILDRSGNVIGKAERWEPEPEPEEEEVDRSMLAGKRVNKAGNVVDGSGTIFGRVVEGEPKRMVGRMCDKKGNILSESGDVIGRAEPVSEGEREGSKEGPFAELSGLTVTREGKVVTPGGDVVGRLVKGDAKTLAGRAVDEDGDVVDKNGNVLGSAERWEEPEVEKRRNPLAGRRVNREGNVVDEDGNLVGKLTTGELSVCSGKEIDDDGDVVDGKGNTVGHVSLLADIPPEPVEEESSEDKAKRELNEKDKELAKRMAAALTQVLDKIKPICEMITRKIEKADRTPKEELDEEELVKEVRPLIEEGGKILQEANGVIRGLDPDGRIQANAKYKSATCEATPEEYHLAEILKELTGTVTKCIEDAKKRLEGMPHAKKELNPLWGLLSEPLFQILAAVGLLLNGVLGLVGRLLSGLGLGGLLDSLLGGLGVKQILQSLGIGSLTDSLTGKNQKKKSGGLLGLGG